MKKKLLIISFFSSFTILFSQETKDLLPKALSYFSTSNSFTSLGNYVSMSTKDNTLNASFYLLTSNRSMFSINVNAGATQGLVTLFDEGKLNSNVSISGEYRYLFTSKKRPYIGYNIPKELLIDNEIKKAENEYNLKRLKLLERVDYMNRAPIDSTDTNTFKVIGSYNVNIKLHSDIKDLLEKTESMLAKYRGIPTSRLSKDEKKLKRELEDNRDKLLKRAKRSSQAVYAFEDNILIEELKSKKAALNKKKKSLNPTFIRLNFFSIGYKANNNVFFRFIEEEDISNQLTKTNYTSHNAFISYNFISNIKNVSSVNGIITDFEPSAYKFLTIGAEYSHTNNQSSLSQIEVIDTKYQNEEGTRTVSKTQNAFIGDYKENLSNLNLFIDYYSFFEKESKSLAFHINPALLLRENKKAVASLQVGLLFPFTKKEDNKSIINIELFYKFKDILNNTNNTNALLNRNIIGLQTSFPFNF